MLTLLLVVGGKLFLVQGLDVGGMAEAALNNRLTPIELPAERGSILDANGTVLASSVIRYNIVVDQTVNTKTETFRRLEPVERQGRTRQGIPGPGHHRARRSAWHGAERRQGCPHRGQAVLHRGQGPEARRRGPHLQAADPRHRHRRHQQARLPQRLRRRRHRGLPEGRHHRPGRAGTDPGRDPQGRTRQAALRNRCRRPAHPGRRGPADPGRQRQGHQAHAELGPPVLRAAGHPKPAGQARRRMGRHHRLGRQNRQHHRHGGHQLPGSQRPRQGRLPKTAASGPSPPPTSPDRWKR